uniref:Uncharacterized protein n=1 Tax=Octopus bimaculoides TaxID=37653 RepID=A0A0L8H938_OCTBM
MNIRVSNRNYKIFIKHKIMFYVLKNYHCRKTKQFDIMRILVILHVLKISTKNCYRSH